jgi:hypothetical protein
MTPPFTWDAALKVPGDPTFEWGISTLTDGGVWRISATYFAFGE